MTKGKQIRNVRKAMRKKGIDVRKPYRVPPVDSAVKRVIIRDRRRERKSVEGVDSSVSTPGDMHNTHASGSKQTTPEQALPQYGSAMGLLPEIVEPDDPEEFYMMPKHILELHLTKKEIMFAHEYTKDFNQSRSFIAAGFKSDCNAVRVRRKPRVDAYIERILQERKEACQVESEKVINELMCIAFSDLTDFATWEAVEDTIPATYDAKGKLKTPEKKKRRNVLKLRDIDELQPHQTACISKLRQGQFGIEITLHNKLTALKMLGDNLQLFHGKTDDKKQLERAADLANLLSQLSFDEVEYLKKRLMPSANVKGTSLTRLGECR